MVGLSLRRKNCAEMHLLLRRQLDGQRRLAGIERVLDLHQHGVFRGRVLVAALDLFRDAFAALPHRLEIREHQLGIDDLDVADRIHRPRHVQHILIVKAPHHLHDGVDLADVRQELVAEPFPVAGALDQAGDVHELDRGGDHHLGPGDPLQLGKPGIRHGDDADVGVDGAERIVGRFGLAGAGDGVKQGGLADIGQSDDSGSQHDDDEAPGANDNFSGYLTPSTTSYTSAPWA